MVPFFPIGWLNLYILFSLRKLYWSTKKLMTDDTWVGKDGTHFFAGHSDTLTESRVHIDRKGESSSCRTLISAPTCNNTSKKVWNCPRLRRAEHLSPQYSTLSDFHYQIHTDSNLKICNKTDLIVKNSIFPKNNCRNIWIIQIKVVTLHHQNNNSNNN